jgi:hypothetical protein
MKQHEQFYTGKYNLAAKFYASSLGVIWDGNEEQTAYVLNSTTVELVKAYNLHQTKRVPKIHIVYFYRSHLNARLYLAGNILYAQNASELC